METTLVQPIAEKKGVGAKVWTGRVISALLILFLLFDAIMKIILESHSVQGSVALGWPENAIQDIGIVLFISTVLYCIPRTAVLGAILLTGYLGGAIAVMVRAGQPLYFSTVFAILVWLGLYLRDARVRGFFHFD
ncbi:MAG: DoxX family protein [Mucilaginibacter polytrichastri]|nr:DoxX family protein [Mucilaginibacter polytrichastri]